MVVGKGVFRQNNIGEEREREGEERKKRETSQMIVLRNSTVLQI